MNDKGKVHSVLWPQGGCFEVFHLCPLGSAHGGEKVDAGEFLDLADGGDVAHYPRFPTAAGVLGVVVREQDGDALVGPEQVFVENDFVEVRGDGHVVLEALRVFVLVPLAIAVAVEHRAADHVEVAIFVAPAAHRFLQPFPCVPVKVRLLRRHVGVEIGVHHHLFGLGEVGVRREMALVVTRLGIVIALGALRGGEARVGPKTFRARAVRGDLFLGQLIGNPERYAQVVIVPDEVILLLEEMFVRGVGGRDGQAVSDVFGFGRFLLRGREEQRLVVLLFLRLGNVTARARRFGGASGNKGDGDEDEPNN